MGRIIAGVLVTLLGIGLALGALATGRSTLEFKAASSLTEGTVVDFATHQSDGKTMYSPIVEYTVEGRALQLSSSSSSSSPGYDRGERVPVRYSNTTPENARIDSFMENWFGPLILGVLGLLATLIGVGLTLAGIRRRRVRNWLAQHGMKVRAKLMGSELNTSYAVNGKHPWRVNAQWQHPVTQKIYIFQSDNVWFDPTEYCTSESIDALVNADDPRQYQLDTSFLPQRA